MRQIANFSFVALITSVLTIAGYHYFIKENTKTVIIERNNEKSNAIQTSYTPNMLPGEQLSMDFNASAENALHAVVHIKTEFTQKSSVYDDYFSIEDFFFNGKARVFKASGSGVIISSDGYIVTNNHVVQQADKITVVLNDKRSYTARIIGLDPNTDLALIKIDSKDLPYLTFGNSDALKIGEWVLAVGNPFNLTSTVTAGIVSAKARNINILGDVSAIESFIQTDAVVNRGNSGGALVNTKGELVGINAAIASNTGSYTGYSFAIPVNIVEKVIDDILDYGEIQRAYLGISFREIDSRFADEKGFKKINGVYVVEVIEDGAAAEAGIRKGDVIVKVNNTDINSKSSLLETIGTQRPGNEVKVIVRRDEQLREYIVVLKNRSGNTDIVKKDNIDILGATFEKISDKEIENLNIEHGLKIVNLQSGKLKSSGIREGFIVMYIDKEPVKSVNDLKYLLEGKHGGTLIEGIYPNGQRAYYGVGL
jgi:Do/DeqQ family serine protease